MALLRLGADCDLPFLPLLRPPWWKCEPECSWLQSVGDCWPCHYTDNSAQQSAASLLSEPSESEFRHSKSRTEFPTEGLLLDPELLTTQPPVAHCYATSCAPRTHTRCDTQQPWVWAYRCINV